MINFIIYEDGEIIRKNYVKLIRKFMGSNDTTYKIHQFSSYNPSLQEFIANNTGYNIYILDIEVPGKSGLDLARQIRMSGDIDSQLIIVTAHRELLENSFVNRSLILNFVSKFDNCESKLYDLIKTAYSNLTKHKSFIFKKDGDLYRIPYDDIYYFEMDSDLGYVNLYTKTNNFVIKKSINSILNNLKDPRFMKTHKSCIVNIYNIKHVDLNNLIIYFSEDISTNLFSRNYKKELQDRMIKG